MNVESGLLAKEAEALNAGFLMRMRAGRPFVRLKSAASLDGRTALANGASKWITSEAARADVQHWRAQSGAMLTSADTVLADDPRLDVRIDAPRQPLRVVLDRRRRVRKTAPFLRPPGEVLLFAAAAGRESTSERAARRKRWARRASSACASCAGTWTWSACSRGWRELEINEVLVEAGPRLSGALLAAGLVDEWLLYLAPKLLGKDAKPLAALARLTKLRRRAGVRRCSNRRRVGPDLRLRLRPTRQTEGVQHVHRHRAGNRRDRRVEARAGAPARRRSPRRRSRSRASRASGWRSATASRGRRVPHRGGTRRRQLRRRCVGRNACA